MNSIRYWQIDAFADRAFSGNPAAVCWLETEAGPTWMQSVAAELNLSETAFVSRRGTDFDLRWFTPTIEVDLCGHATLATAYSLWSEGLAQRDQPIRFHTRSGVLTCRSSDDYIELDFPAAPPKEIAASSNLLDALGVSHAWVGDSTFYRLVVVQSAEEVRRMQPDFVELLKEKTLGIIVTAPSDDVRFDFISRFFAPAMGVNEDPVCGSAHCCLTPYWADRLQKQRFTAFQASVRGGVLKLKLDGDRVILGGKAVMVARGELLC